MLTREALNNFIIDFDVIVDIDSFGEESIQWSARTRYLPGVIEYEESAEEAIKALFVSVVTTEDVLNIDLLKDYEDLI